MINQSPYGCFILSIPISSWQGSCWDPRIQLFSLFLAPLTFMIAWEESATGGYSSHFICILRATYGYMG